MKPDYDVIIIGSGPAGICAGIYASRARLNTLIIEKGAIGGQIILSDCIENYPGFPEGINGYELMDKMASQAKNFGTNFESDEVISFDLSNQIKKVNLSNKIITAYSIIISTGASPKKLGTLGEDTYYGKGISFCATCDAPFYKNSVVAAVGGGDTAVQESIYLTKFAKKVYLIHRRDELRAAKILQEKAFSNEKIEFIWNSKVTQINGSSGVESITVQNLKTSNTQNLSIDGLFVWIGVSPNSSFLKNSLSLDKDGFIITNAKMETSVKGVFAAGDIRDTPLRQVSSAIGDGAIAAISAIHYIENIKK
ncbi:MAG: thioredoxin-disulfide reductase [Desulfobacterales bacterium]|nr:thioredoxin-disulfide reductase [Desulfobacterales bacterium]